MGLDRKRAIGERGAGERISHLPNELTTCEANYGASDYYARQNKRPLPRRINVTEDEGEKA